MIHIFDNVLLFKPYTGEWLPASFTVENGVVVEVGANHNLTVDVITNLGRYG